MKLNIKHNLEEHELEEALEKALTGLKRSSESPDSPMKDKLSEELKQESFKLFDKVYSNMVKEISKVINKG